MQYSIIRDIVAPYLLQLAQQESKIKVKLTREELDGFHVAQLSFDSYIILGNKFFKPAKLSFETKQEDEEEKAGVTSGEI